MTLLKRGIIIFANRERIAALFRTIVFVVVASGTSVIASADMPVPIYRHHALSQADWSAEKNRQISRAVENHLSRGTREKSGQPINVANVVSYAVEGIVVILVVATPIAFLVVCVRRRKRFKSLACLIWLLCALPMAVVITAWFDMRRDRLPSAGNMMVAWQYGHREIVDRSIEPRLGESYPSYLKRAEHIEFALCSDCNLPRLLSNRCCYHCALDGRKRKCRNQDFVDALKEYCATGTDEEYIRKAEEALRIEEAKDREMDVVSNAAVDSTQADDVPLDNSEVLAGKAKESYEAGRYRDTVKFFFDAAKAGHRLSDDEFSMAKLAFRNRMEQLNFEIGEMINLQSRGYEQPKLNGLKSERSGFIDRCYRLRNLCRSVSIGGDRRK